MAEKIIPACDAVYVSEGNPRRNLFNKGIIKVGFSKYLTIDDCFGPAWSKGPRENIGLLQFKPFDLPTNSEILSARLHLFVRSTRNESSSVRVYSNKEYFDKDTVKWEARPKYYKAPFSTLLVEKQNQCSYASCDITDLVKGNSSGRFYGLSLIASREAKDEITFCSDECAHPVYISIEYSKCKPYPILPGTIKNVFQEHIYEVQGTDDELFTQTIDMETAQRITFFVKNTGSGSISANLQISPNGIDFVNDSQVLTLQTNEIYALTPYLFAKYMRVRITPQNAGEYVNAYVCCQIQTFDYIMENPGSI